MAVDQPTVYVVEDDPGERRLLADVLQQQAYFVESFASAEEFLQQDALREHACVITDMRMLGMSGLDLQRALLDRGSHLPVILVSGFATVPVAVEAMQMQAVTVLQKPWSDRDIQSHVEQALDQAIRSADQRRDQVEAKRLIERLKAAEDEVLELLVEGKSNKQVAKALDIGLRTAELRRAKIMQKLEVNSLAEVIRLAVLARGE
jgi:FixJ family two-component response regulator